MTKIRFTKLFFAILSVVILAALAACGDLAEMKEKKETTSSRQTARVAVWKGFDTNFIKKTTYPKEGRHEEKK